MTILIGFFLAKSVVYWVWCIVGLAVVEPARRATMGLLVAASAGRVIAGVALAIGWSWVLATVAPSREYRTGFNPVIFEGGLIALRWCAWSGVSWALARRAASWRLFGAARGDHLWRLGGVGISTFGDLLVLLGIMSLGSC